jgi:aryl-alcohol dehydrogenase-like predicted oxidoreductase
MERIQLGRTGITVSRLCFGTLTLAPMQKNLPVGQAADLIAAAIDMGVFFFDTAELYDNYQSLAAGFALRTNSTIVTASKTYAYTAKDAAAAVEKARIGLNRDVIDIFLLHEQESRHTLRGHAEALEELFRAKDAGRIRAVGLSTHHVSGVTAAAGAALDIVHPLLNYTGLGITGGLTAMETAIENAHKAGLGIYSMKALGGGHHYRSAGAAMDYVLRRPGVDSVAVGIGSIEELRRNVYFFNNRSFPADSYLADRREIWIDPACTGCRSCVAHCPCKALRGNGSAVTCEHNDCLLCGYCAAYCPNFFIKIV